jgi:calcium-dependent protein kinase
MRIYELLEDDNFYFIVSEYIRHGELYDFVQTKCNSPKGQLNEVEVKEIVKQVFTSLNYMHQNNIVHRDIKPENILIENVENL